MPTIAELRVLCPSGEVRKDTDGTFEFRQYLNGSQSPPVAPAGYVWREVKHKHKASHWDLDKFTTQAEVTRRITLAREPWREYYPYKPDDMPGKNGSPAALAKLLAECGETDEPQLKEAA